MATAGSDWQNFLNWLSSPQGAFFYIMLFWTFLLLLALIVLTYPHGTHRTHELGRLTSVLVWLGATLPLVVLGVFVPGGSSVCAPPLAIFLALGLLAIGFRSRE